MNGTGKYLFKNGRMLHIGARILLLVCATLTVVSSFSLLEKSPVEMEINESDDSNPEEPESLLKSSYLWPERENVFTHNGHIVPGFYHFHYTLPDHLASNVTTPPPQTGC
ncbi:MAG TPA: hypothetical protein DCG19_07530 [Cryomorphaceae bacterium]|nr:hypothetical protein [Owenweeksia sp.]HAD97243.1 hypothetical protein [Cryomorphaceae bacterium]HBF21272.1 hypothetical protein [Cryomorphaceae bacterium]